MAAPVIALRFRDATPDVDTISAHRSILGREGAVWWGWWKKDFEDDHAEFLSTLEPHGPIEFLIVDRSTKRMFQARCLRWETGNRNKIDLDRVPEYYREYAAQVFGWFLVGSIVDVAFDDALAAKFGDHTFLRLDRNDTDDLGEKLASAAAATDKSCILHLSDLHFGADYAFLPQGEIPGIGDPRKTLAECIASDLDRIKLCNDVAAVIVTGDFTTAGDWSDATREQVLAEFKALRTALDIKPQQIIPLPGNHDIIRYPPGASPDINKIILNNQTSYQHEREFRTFVDELVGRSWKESLNYVRRVNLKTVDVLVCVLNSCTISPTQWTEYGFVGTSGLDAIVTLEKETVNRPTYKMVALHHHLLPVAAVEAPNSKGVTLSLDASALLDAAQQAGVHIALHGHQHMPRLVRYQTIPFMGKQARLPLHVVSNGSTGGKRLPGNERNSYCLFRLTDEEATLWLREIRPDGRDGATLFEGVLEVSPQSPVRG
jgi:hypothetical protein